MKVRIGAIGPRDSLDQMKEVARTDSRIELVEFEYFHQDMLEHILKDNRYDVTQWIFSGQQPYYYALDKGWITEEEGAFIPLHGIAFLGTILQIFLERKEITTSISVDTVDEEIVLQVLKEYNIHSLNFELFSYERHGTYEEIIDFHIRNFNAKKTEVAVTCLVTVYQELQKLGIPCFRIVPSQLAIRSIFNLLVTRATSQIFEKSKVAIVGFELHHGTIKVIGDTYEAKKKRLAAELAILAIAEKLNGTLVNTQEGRFYIYTTYGDFELLHLSQSITKLVQEIELETSLNLKVGIGSGHTVYEAMQNIELAFENNQNEADKKIFFDSQMKEIPEFITEGNQYYTVERLPEDWKKVLKEHNYTPTIPAKIYHYLKLKKIESFDSELITNLLKNTDRNTRRILQDLEQMGLLEVTEESTGKPGRPRKIYQFKNN
ncbi:hypothetical protein [Bacillus ndiopicus]|uniref:hypothetical protein n=1 Tax=Bacillus ndiopicus TaxID=1347368 RepID=UPI0005A8689B|nr:hypothetical protein [Bacillus ndiopicus]